MCTLAHYLMIPLWCCLQCDGGFENWPCSSWFPRYSAARPWRYLMFHYHFSSCLVLLCFRTQIKCFTKANIYSGLIFFTSKQWNWSVLTAAYVSFIAAIPESIELLELALKYQPDYVNIFLTYIHTLEVITWLLLWYTLCVSFPLLWVRNELHICTCIS